MNCNLFFGIVYHPLCPVLGCAALFGGGTTKDAKKIWLLPEDGRPSAPKAQSKAFIKKVTFLVAIGQPHKRLNETHFCGLVGIWPSVKEGIAARSSENRVAGETELKLVSVDGNVWRDMMVEKVFPTIRDAYKHLKKQVVIQIDGAKPHIKSLIQASIEVECSKQGYNITLEWQPAQSPKSTVLDLGVFHSLQVQASKIKDSGNLQDVVDAVTTYCDVCPFGLTCQHVAASWASQLGSYW